MRKVLLGLALVLVAGDVLAQGGSATKPMFVRKWQGDTRDFKEVSCTTAGSVELVSAAEAANAMSIYFYNTDGTNPATLCPRAAVSGACDSITEGLTLKAVTGFTSDVSVAGPWSCMATGGNVTVEVYIERDYGTSTLPTPTPLTPTPTP